MADDAELLELLYQANFRSVFVGIETPRVASLNETKKFQNTRGDSLEAKLVRIRNAGLKVVTATWPGGDGATIRVNGVVVQAATPRPIVELLHREIVKIVAQPDVQEKLAGLGFVAVANTPEEFSARIKAEIPKWAKVIRDANIKAE